MEHSAKESRLLARAAQKARRLGLPAERTMLLCCDPRGRCASRRETREAWKYLKRRLNELGLARRGRVGRLKSRCLDICIAGPIVIVFPEAVWYGLCRPPVIERILQEHILGGRIVGDYVIAEPPMCARMSAGDLALQDRAAEYPAP